MAVAAPVRPGAVAVDGPVDDEEPRGLARLARPRLSVAFGLGFVLWGAVIGVGSLSDNSFFTHLATGRIIWDTGSVPTHDPYSFTAHGEPWVVQSWFASVLYAGAEKLGGFGGVRLLNAALAALAMAVVWRLCRRAESVPGRVLLATVAAVVATGRWTHRPLLIGVIAFGIVLLALEDEDFDPRWLVPVGWIWVNTHGSFPYGVLACAMVALGTRLDGRQPRHELRVLGWTTAGIAAGALNPLGLKLLVFPLGVLQKSDAFKTILEWQAPDFESWQSLIFLVQLLLAVLLLAHRPRWRAAIPMVVFAGLALTSARNITQASLMLLPGMAVSMGSVRLGAISLERRSRSARLGAVAMAALVVLVPLALLRSRPDVQLAPYPMKALDWIDDHGGWTERHVATQDFVGNLLAAREGPEGVTFYDDRVDMYPEEVVFDYRTLGFALPGWDDVLDQYDIETVLWARDQPLAQVLEASPAWKRVYGDKDWVIYRRSP